MKGMAVAPQPRAAEEAVEALRNGGNAVDAAITAAFVQGIVDPLNCGMGGLGWMHVYDAATGEDVILDFCSVAGSRATPDMWEGLIDRQGEDGLGYILKGDVNEIGYQSIGLPTGIRGLHEALTRYGTWTWDRAIAPAARLAREGYVVPREIAEEWRSRYSPGRPVAMTRFSVTPDAAAIYTRNGAPLDDGDLLQNPDYAASLERIAEAGPDDYYSGEIAGRLVADWEANGGYVTADDLANYRPEYLAPVRGTYRGYTISDQPPPSGGVTLVQVLNILEGYDLASMGHNSAEYIRVLALALGAGFEDRGKYMGDPAFVDVPVEMLTSKEYAADWRRRIERGEGPDAGRARPIDGAGTTHISVVDRDGSCVSLTHTNGLCSGVITPGLGFLQNNYMISFDPKPGGPNSIEPGKKRTTGASPCIVYRDGVPFMVLGAPGGTYIIGAVLQTILNVIDHGMTALEAVSAPRIDCQGDTVYVEGRVPGSVCDELRAGGLQVLRDTSSYGLYPSRSARVQAIVLGDHRGEPSGGSDPRGYGAALKA